jgi:hypothetical protein
MVCLIEKMTLTYLPPNTHLHTETHTKYIVSEERPLNLVSLIVFTTVFQLRSKHNENWCRRKNIFRFPTLTLTRDLECSRKFKTESVSKPDPVYICSNYRTKRQTPQLIN